MLLFTLLWKARTNFLKLSEFLLWMHWFFTEFILKLDCSKYSSWHIWKTQKSDPKFSGCWRFVLAGRWRCPRQIIIPVFLSHFFFYFHFIKSNNSQHKPAKSLKNPSKSLLPNRDSALIGVECNKIQGSSVSQINILIEIEKPPSAHLLLHPTFISKRFDVEQMLLDAMQLFTSHLFAEVNELQDVQIGKDILVSVYDETLHALWLLLLVLYLHLYLSRGGSTLFACFFGGIRKIRGK